MKVVIQAGKNYLPFSQAIRCGDLVFVSGQAAVNPETGEIMKGTLNEEMTLSFQNLRRVLEAADSTWEEIVKVNCFVRRESDVAEYNQIYREFFSHPYPARTTTTGCLPPTILFEVDCVAYSPASHRDPDHETQG
jgi:2-iminobutanoate/2-iminopropanoate deaminase